MGPEGGPGPEFLSDKFNLHKQPEVDKSIEKLRDEGVKVPATKADRIEAHFGRIEHALESKRGLFTHLVKDKLFKDYTINLQNKDGSENTKRVDQLVQGLFESEKEILRRRGMGEELKAYGDEPTQEDSEKFKQQIYSKKAEQEKTLGNWVDYLGSEEANAYPVWFKYLTLRSLWKMGKRDRDAENYSNRSGNTLQPFPDLSREALALTLTAIKAMVPTTAVDYRGKEVKIKGTTLDLSKQEEYSDEELQAQAEIDRLADKGDFAKLYAHFQGEIERAKREKGEGTAGKWIHYPQDSKGSSAEALYKTLEGKGTEWCTAGLDIATNQLKAGEFYIYYTYDKDQKPTDPRVAIYLINGQISEVRGVYGKDQDLELDFVDIARDKYKDFQGSEKYEKKDRDMKALTSIEYKTKKGIDLTKEDLTFLYEIDSKIEGFGHGADPRVAEIRGQRKDQLENDMLTIFECSKEQITRSEVDVKRNIDDGISTKAYIGNLYPGIFTQLSSLEHIYTSFPEGEVSQGEFETTGKNGLDLKIELEDQKINPNENATFMLQSHEFITSPAGEKISIVHLKVRDLFSDNQSHSYSQIITRADELGLDLLPHETGPVLLLKEETRPRLGGWHSVATKPIADRSGNPSVFYLSRDGDGRWLSRNWAKPDDDEWRSSRGFVFRLRKDSQET